MGNFWSNFGFHKHAKLPAVQPQPSQAKPAQGATVKPASVNVQPQFAASEGKPATREQLHEMYSEWANSLTPQEKKAFEAYRTPGVYYILNYFLRHGELPEQKPWQHFTPDSVRNLAYTLSKAIEKAPALKEPMVVYRSMVLPDRLRGLNGQLQGKWLEDRAFMSTTADMGVLKNFEQKRLTKPDKNHEPVCMKITLPAGTKVAYIEEALKSGFSEEEMLLPLGQPNGHSLQFTGCVKNEDGLPAVTARFVQNGARENWHPAFPPGWKPTSFDLSDNFES